MIDTLYLPEGSTLLAERWLAERRPGEKVRLLHDAGASEGARALAAAWPAVVEVARMEEVGNKESDYDYDYDARLTTHEGKRDYDYEHEHEPGWRVILPITLGVHPLVFLRPAGVPEVGPIYPLIRRLWGMGARRFRVTNYGGEFEFKAPHLLDQFVGRHEGKRCFIIGNGPSLNQIDMTRLKGEITFGANRGYLGCERWGFAFSYWGVIDFLQIEEYGAEYERALPETTVKFYPFEYAPLRRFENSCPLNLPYAARPVFRQTPEELYRGHSVVFTLVQVAALMGCDPIVLVGMDHRYGIREGIGARLRRDIRQALVRPFFGTPVYEGLRAWRQAARARRPGAPEGPGSGGAATGPTPALWKMEDAQGPTHFDPRYTDGGRVKFMMPFPREAERDYRCAARWAREHRRRILNATPGSALEAFDRADYDGLF